MLATAGKYVLGRGVWSPKETSGSPFPYGEARSLALNHPFFNQLIRVYATGGTSSSTYMNVMCRYPLLHQLWFYQLGLSIMQLIFSNDDEAASNNQGNQILDQPNKIVVSDDILKNSLHHLTQTNHMSYYWSIIRVFISFKSSYTLPLRCSRTQVRLLLKDMNTITKYNTWVKGTRFFLSPYFNSKTLFNAFQP